VTVGGEAPVTPVLSLDSSCLNPSYKPCDNRHKVEELYYFSFSHPWQTDVLNRTLVQLLRGYNTEHPNPWDEKLVYN